MKFNDLMLVGMFQYVYFPVLVGLVLYFSKLYIQRRSLKYSLIMEINMMLTFSEEIRGYLKSDDHYWLKVGNIIKRSPTDTGPTILLFVSLLPSFYLLSKTDLEKVLRFYRHHQLCANLTRSLYDGIREFSKRNEPITDDDVRLFKLKKDRIVNAYESLLQVTDGQIHRIKDLPSSYSIIPTEAIAGKANELLVKNTATYKRK